MHSDFKYNFMRINLLKLGEEEKIELDRLNGFFEKKGIMDVSADEIKAQAEHLTKENYLSKKSENNYELTEAGQKELNKVKNAVEKF